MTGADDFDRDGERRERQLDTLVRLSQRFGTSLSDAFARNVAEGRRLTACSRASGAPSSPRPFAPPCSPRGTRSSGLAGLFGGGGATPFARGGVLAGGRAVPFARGRRGRRADLFPSAVARISRGGLGLMGERGAEAVMPLARGPDGRLGVRAGGGGRPVSVTVNIAAGDVESFRRSETQVAAASPAPWRAASGACEREAFAQHRGSAHGIRFPRGPFSPRRRLRQPRRPVRRTDIVTLASGREHRNAAGPIRAGATMPGSACARSTRSTRSSPSSRSGAGGSTAFASATGSTGAPARPRRRRRRATRHRHGRRRDGDVPAASRPTAPRTRPTRGRSPSRSPARCASRSTASSRRSGRTSPAIPRPGS